MESLFAQRHRSHATDILGGSGRDRGGRDRRLPACMQPLKVPYGCVQQSALQHRGREGGGAVGMGAIPSYINILGVGRK